MLQQNEKIFKKIFLFLYVIIINWTLYDLSKLCDFILIFWIQNWKLMQNQIQKGKYFWTFKNMKDF